MILLSHIYIFFPLSFVVQGFYAVYGDVFRQLASEEAQYRESGAATDDDPLPEFGMPF